MLCNNSSFTKEFLHIHKRDINRFASKDHSSANLRYYFNRNLSISFGVGKQHLYPIKVRLTREEYYDILHLFRFNVRDKYVRKGKKEYLSYIIDSIKFSNKKMEDGDDLGRHDYTLHSALTDSLDETIILFDILIKEGARKITTPANIVFDKYIVSEAERFDGNYNIEVKKNMGGYDVDIVLSLDSLIYLNLTPIEINSKEHFIYSYLGSMFDLFLDNKITPFKLLTKFYYLNKMLSIIESKGYGVYYILKEKESSSPFANAVSEAISYLFPIIRLD